MKAKLRPMSATRFFGLFCVVLLTISACVNPPDYPNIPVIDYQGVNKTTIYQGTSNNPNDTLAIFFSFTDGDGDLSFEDSTDIFLADSRFPSVRTPFRLPLIPEDGTGNGIRGEITLRILNKPSGICCIQNNVACPLNPTEPTDTFSYEIQLRDRAGNFSNFIRTELLTIQCE